MGEVYHLMQIPTTGKGTEEKERKIKYYQLRGETCHRYFNRSGLTM